MRLKMIAGGDPVDYDVLTAKAENVVEGLVFLGADSDEEQVGTLPDMENMYGAPGFSSSDTGTPVHGAAYVAVTTDTGGAKKIALSPPKGKYPGTKDAYVGCTPAQIGVTAEKVANGQTAAGVAGTYGSDATVTADDMKEGKVAYGESGRLIGSRKDYGTVQKTLAAGESYTINKGMYDAGKVTAQGLSAQTDATATASQILENFTAWVKGTKLAGAMKHLTDRASVQYASGNSTKVIPGDAAFYQSNTDGVKRFLIRYNSDGGYITGNTLFGIARDTLLSVLGITADKILSGQSIADVAGTATNDAVLVPAYLLEGYSGYDDGVLKQGTMKNCGQYQYGGFGEGTDYYAINAMPEGAYFSNGASWAPEGRCSKDTVRSYLGVSANKILSGQSIAGISGTQHKYGEAHGQITSGTSREIEGSHAKAYLNLGFTPLLVVLMSYMKSGSTSYRDVTIMSNLYNGSSKYGNALNFNQQKMNGYNSNAWNNGESGVVTSGKNLVLPVAYTGSTYDYWAVGYY